MSSPLPWSTRHLLDDSAEELTAIAAWGDQRVLVGTASGSLLHFAPTADNALPSLRERKRTHTHSIVQLAVGRNVTVVAWKSSVKQVSLVTPLRCLRLAQY